MYFWISNFEFWSLKFKFQIWFHCYIIRSQNPLSNFFLTWISFYIVLELSTVIYQIIYQFWIWYLQLANFKARWGFFHVMKKFWFFKYDFIFYLFICIFRLATLFNHWFRKFKIGSSTSVILYLRFRINPNTYKGGKSLQSFPGYTHAIQTDRCDCFSWPIYHQSALNLTLPLDIKWRISTDKISK